MSEYMYTDIYMLEKPNIYMYMYETQNKCYVEPLGRRGEYHFVVVIWPGLGYILSISVGVANQGKIFPATLCSFLRLKTVTAIN